MLKNYLKTAWRSLWRNRTTSFISIAGLAMGVTCFLLLGTYLLNELRYDRFHKNADRIVLVTFHYKSADDPEAIGAAVTPTAVVPVFKEMLSDIEDGVRVYNYTSGKSATVRFKDKLFSEKNILLADRSFFKIFSFQFLAGNPATALNNPNSIVITASTAKKYFGQEDALGKMLTINAVPWQVTGIIADVPPYSQLKFNLLGSYSTLPRSKKEAWSAANDISYFLLKPGVPPNRALGWTPEQAVGKRINLDGRYGEVKAVLKDFNFASLHQVITPIVVFLEYNWFGKILIKTSGADMRNTLAGVEKTWNDFYKNEPFEYHFLDQEYEGLYKTERRTSAVLNIFSIITIIVSCLGLFGLAVFISEQRTKEIGIRKVLGASAANIAAMLSGSFIRLVIIAIIIAAPIAWLAMHKWLQDFSYRININWWIFLIAGVLSALIALITVSLQAIKAALANPVKALRAE